MTKTTPTTLLIISTVFLYFIATLPLQAKPKLYCDKPKSAYKKVIRGTNKNDKIKGTKGADLIFGLGGNDIIDGKKGNDCIYGGKGHDRILGGKGQDTIYGGPGNDKIIGHQGNDRLYGNDGNDHIQGNSGKDILNAGTGKNTLVAGDPINNGDNLIGDSNDTCIYKGAKADSCEPTTPLQNRPPIIEGVQSRYIVNPLDTLHIAPSITDPDRDEVSVSWVQTFGSIDLINHATDPRELLIYLPDTSANTEVFRFKISVNDGETILEQEIEIILTSGRYYSIEDAAEILPDHNGLMAEHIDNTDITFDFSKFIHNTGLVDINDDKIIINTYSPSGATIDMSRTTFRFIPSFSPNLQTFEDPFVYNPSTGTLTSRDNLNITEMLVSLGEDIDAINDAALSISGFDSYGRDISKEVRFRVYHPAKREQIRAQIYAPNGHPYKPPQGQTVMSKLTGYQTGITQEVPIAPDGTLRTSNLISDNYDIEILTPEGWYARVGQIVKAEDSLEFGYTSSRLYVPRIELTDLHQVGHDENEPGELELPDSATEQFSTLRLLRATLRETVQTEETPLELSGLMPFASRTQPLRVAGAKVTMNPNAFPFSPNTHDYGNHHWDDVYTPLADISDFELRGIDKTIDESDPYYPVRLRYKHHFIRHTLKLDHLEDTPKPLNYIKVQGYFVNTQDYEINRYGAAVRVHDRLAYLVKIGNQTITDSFTSSEVFASRPSYVFTRYIPLEAPITDETLATIYASNIAMPIHESGAAMNINVGLVHKPVFTVKKFELSSGLGIGQYNERLISLSRDSQQPWTAEVEYLPEDASIESIDCAFQSPHINLDVESHLNMTSPGKATITMQFRNQDDAPNGDIETILDLQSKFNSLRFQGYIHCAFMPEGNQAPPRFVNMTNPIGANPLIPLFKSREDKYDTLLGYNNHHFSRILVSAIVDAPSEELSKATPIMLSQEHGGCLRKSDYQGPYNTNVKNCTAENRLSDRHQSGYAIDYRYPDIVEGTPFTAKQLRALLAQTSTDINTAVLVANWVKLTREILEISASTSHSIRISKAPWFFNLILDGVDESGNPIPSLERWNLGPKLHSGKLVMSSAFARILRYKGYDNHFQVEYSLKRYFTQGYPYFN